MLGLPGHLGQGIRGGDILQQTLLFDQLGGDGDENLVTHDRTIAYSEILAVDGGSG